MTLLEARKLAIGAVRRAGHMTARFARNRMMSHVRVPNKALIRQTTTCKLLVRTQTKFLVALLIVTMAYILQHSFGNAQYTVNVPVKEIKGEWTINGNRIIIVASVLQLFEFDDSEIECECIQSKPGSHFAFIFGNAQYTVNVPVKEIKGEWTINGNRITWTENGFKLLLRFFNCSSSMILRLNVNVYKVNPVATLPLYI
jgi:hypothetical protein